MVKSEVKKVNERFQSLLISALVLREKMLSDERLEIIQARIEVFNKDLVELSSLIPKEIMNSGFLLRHAGFIQHWVDKNALENCRNDIIQICEKDIFHVQNEFILSQVYVDNSSLNGNYSWSLIHPVVCDVSKTLFENKHYAEAVEAAFKEINDVVKKGYKKKKGIEEDGDSLMRKSFSPAHPVFKFTSMQTDSDKNIQHGYMEIFAGANRGIRNPKAHKNMEVIPDEAWEMIVLASHLMRMWDKTQKY